MRNSIQPTAQPFVTRLRARDYKSLKSCDVAFGPLTILTGFNAAGKSTVLDAIRLVRDALALSPEGAIAKRGGLESVLRRGKEAGERGADSFAISLDLAFPDGQGGAAYEIEIGRDPAGRHPLVVINEKLTLTVRDEQARYAVDYAADGHREVHGGEIPGAKLGVDALLLPIVGRLAPYDVLLDKLLAMRFYELDTTVLRELDNTRAPHRQLGERGEHLGQVLGVLAEEHPMFKQAIDETMRWLVPSLLGVDRRMQGDYATIQARFWTGDPHLPYWDAVNSGAVGSQDPRVQVFQSDELSEGTVQAMGVLVALNQPEAISGAIPLVAIEEPEYAIHPARVAGLLAEMAEAANRTQVIVTTQSSELLDAEEMDPVWLRIVEMDEAVSRVGPLSDETIEILRKNPSYLPDMHRQGHLSPKDDRERKAAR
ncbi:AAA family ATPase [Nonomuraea cavernae]|uniref:AAA family ATPase n=1 Tax=Nonomuraea cavernae TaxID=2045107 RepID=UPI00340BF162